MICFLMQLFLKLTFCNNFFFSYGHFLPDDEFPLLRMKEPVTVQVVFHLKMHYL